VQIQSPTFLIGMDIDYLDEFDDLQQKSTFRGEQWFGERQRLVETYSWAVPTPDVITYCAEYDNLISVGAGNGYWEHLIEENGGSVFAFDEEPPNETYTTVESGTVTKYGSKIMNSPVLLVWPPYGERMAQAVTDYKPSHILYVGEQRGGCTGNDGFFDRLDREYGLVAKLELPSYKGIHDDFYHYIRKR
jgi:hypothetical protein